VRPYCGPAPAGRSLRGRGQQLQPLHPTEHIKGAAGRHKDRNDKNPRSSRLHRIPDERPAHTAAATCYPKMAARASGSGIPAPPLRQPPFPQTAGAGSGTPEGLHPYPQPDHGGDQLRWDLVGCKTGGGVCRQGHKGSTAPQTAQDNG